MKNETTKRLISGFSIGAGVPLTLYYDGANFLGVFFFVLVTSLFSVHEFYVLTFKTKTEGPFRKTGIFFSICIALSYYAQVLSHWQKNGVKLSSHLHEFVADVFHPDFSLLPLLLLLLILFSGGLQISLRSQKHSLYNLSITAFGPLYVVVTLSHVLLFLLLPHFSFYIFLFLLLPIAMDVGAYFSGKIFGRHKTNSIVSPNKTYEGYIGGVIFTLFMGVAVRWMFSSYFNTTGVAVALGYGEICILALLVASLTIVGDLIESSFKRTALKKDSSSLIPGHGGVLDLLDALYWSIPLGYYYLTLRQYLGYSLFS